MKNLKILLVALILTMLCSPALADHHEEMEMPATGYEGSFARDFDRVSEKLLSLAEAIPADKYGWRPTEEVRSVSESYVHTAGANLFISSHLGVPMPEDFGRDAEQTVTAKADVIALLKSSFEHVKQALQKNAGSDLDEEIDLFGSKRTKRDAFMIMAGHSHEHLGQLIAYARSNGVVPPWSQPAEGEE